MSELGRGDRLAGVAAAVLAGLVGVALLAPLLPLPSAVATDLAHRLLPPGSAGHWLGTDHLGRDLLARVLFGTRVSLAAAALGTAVAAVAGTGLGLFSGWRGGWPDTVLMRGVDILLSFPYILLALTLVAVLGASLWNAAFAVAIVNIPFFARTMRGSTLVLRDREFVEVARLSGLSEFRIVVGEILPNVLPLVIVATTATLGWMILETAGLSFLGLGAQPPQPDLGNMLGQGRRFLTSAPHLALVPGLVIFVLALCVNVLGDALRERLDPKRPTGSDEPLDEPAYASPTAGDSLPSAYQPLLAVDGLCVDVPGAGRVVERVSLAVASGETVAVVGESGSGKTLTALALLGLVPAPGARVTADGLRWRGDDLLRLDPEARRRMRGERIGFVPQDPGDGLDPLLAVGHQVGEALRAHRRISRREARRHVVEVFERVQLADAEGVFWCRPHELSGGMQQRVLIAAALVCDPELVIADEPTTALDVTTQAEILALLDTACRERNRSLLLITHDLGVVSELGDRVVVLRDGCVVETGPVEEVLSAPRHPYTRSLLESAPRLPARPNRVWA